MTGSDITPVHVCDKRPNIYKLDVPLVIFTAVISFVIATAFGMAIGEFDKKESFHKEAVQHGAATYVVEDGVPVFKWKDEVK